MGLKLEDIARRLSDLSPDAIKERVLNWNEPKAIQELGSEDHLHYQFSELRRLGRAEGKALLSEQLNFAAFFMLILENANLNNSLSMMSMSLFPPSAIASNKNCFK